MAFLLNCPEFPDSCLPVQFTGLTDIAQMLINRSHIHFKHYSHQLLRQPDGFILNTHFNRIFSGLSGKNQKFCRAVSDLEFLQCGHADLSFDMKISFEGKISVSLCEYF